MANKTTNRLGRIPPNSLEAEEAVLGCMLINNSSVSKAIDSLHSSSFYNPSNSIIFENIVELFTENLNIDYVGLIDKLKKKKKLSSVGGAYYITGLTTKAPSAENVEYYIQFN